MSVPTHNLYDFIHQTLERHYWVIYFSPFGEKNLSFARRMQKDMSDINHPVTGLTDVTAYKILPEENLTYTHVHNFQPVLFCHDQEPLQFDHYNDSSPFQLSLLQRVKKDHTKGNVDNLNLRLTLPRNWRKTWVLLHSEINSPELEKYESTGRYRGSYFFSHAFLALDWYRYAKYDPAFDISLPKKQTFLIYARDYTGSRFYRKKFVDRIHNISPGSIIGSIDGSGSSSDSSSIYHAPDFCQTDISLVLETIFESQRIHLTEKTLRPIACGHPFILAAGPGSLEILRKYGFRTFHPWIDERYDLETDKDIRTEMILAEMQRIESLGAIEKKQMLDFCQEIALHNKKTFFSDEFFRLIVKELKDNVLSAHDDLLDPTDYLESCKWKENNGIVIEPDPLRSYISNFADYLTKNQVSFEQYQGHQHSLHDKSSTDGDDV